LTTSGVSLTAANGSVVVVSFLMSMLAGPDIEMKLQPPSSTDEIMQHAIAKRFFNRMTTSFAPSWRTLRQVCTTPFRKGPSPAQAARFNASCPAQ
jgi:hypothetical protein